MNSEDILSTLNNFFSGNYNLKIFENQVDMQIQMEYFEYAMDLRKKIDKNQIFENKEMLFSESISVDEKKKILVGLSSIDKVEAFRTLEKFANNEKEELSDWAKLACQESKILIEGSLLGTQQVFISTGLGGKDNKFKYFIGLKSVDDKFLPTQRKIIRKEFDFYSQKYEAEIEEIKFRKNICIGLFYLNFKIRAYNFVNNIINECNTLGNFVNNKYIITNVQKYSFTEVEDIINKQNEKN